jgi:hypothetical protein
MDCRLKCEKPGDIVYTLTVTMKAEQWEKLRGQIDEAKTSYIYPASDLVRQINDLLGQARKVYWPAPASDPQ